MKVGWHIALILMLFASTVCAGSIRDIDVDETIDYGKDFDVTATFGGNIRNSVARFYVDGYEFVPPQNLGAIADEDDKDMRVKWDDSSDDNDWEKFHGSCGEYVLYVELWSTSGEELEDNESVEISMGNVPDLTFDPEHPEEDEEVTLILRDAETGNYADNVKLEIKFTKDGETWERTTDGSGKGSFTPQETGKYTLKLNDREYCGEFDFYIKDEMIIDGPHPSNPVVGENIKIAVKPGVGVLVLDSNNQVVMKPATNIEGGANFTLSDPGDYMILVGNSSTRYWSKNASITVGDRPTPRFSFEPVNPVVGDILTMKLDSRGPLPDALLTITRPDGVAKDYVTDSLGEIIFDGTVNTGLYTLKVSKDRYQDVFDKFEVYHKFSVVTTPGSPTITDDITFTIHDEGGHPVENALIEIPSIGFRDYTSNTGELIARLPDPKTYSISLTKTGFWDESIQITPLGVCEPIFNKETVEVGDEVEISVVNPDGTPINVKISAVNPRGIAETFNGEKINFKPEMTGTYIIKIEKQGFGQVEKQLTVTPHPINIGTHTLNGKLVVNITSNNQPLEAIPFTVQMAGFSKPGVTNNQGLAEVEIPGTGEVNVTITDSTGLYEKKVKAFDVVKDRNYILLIIPIILILGATGVIILGVQYGKFYHRKKKTGKPQRETKRKKDKTSKANLERERGSRLSKI